MSIVGPRPQLVRDMVFMTDEQRKRHDVKSEYPSNEEYLSFKKNKAFQSIIRKGNNLPRFMLKSSETNYDKKNRKLLLSLARTEWSQTSYIQRIGSLRIDFRGHGESEQSLEEFSLKSQIEDLVTAIEWLKNKEDNLRIITLGISFGAPPIMVVSELYSSIIKKCVLIAPVVDYKNTFLYPVTDWGRENFGYKKIIEGICTGGINLDEKYRLGREVLMDILLVDVAQFVKNTSYPMYIFHGESDNMVPAILSKEFSKIRSNIKIFLMKKTEHGLTEVGDEEFLSNISIENMKKVIEEISE